MLTKREEISIQGILWGALTGALLGAIVSVVLMASRSDDKERVSPGIRNYFQLLLAMFMLAKQAGELVAGQPKEA